VHLPLWPGRNSVKYRNVPISINFSMKSYKFNIQYILKANVQILLYQISISDRYNIFKKSVIMI
jgi:hypothetical protein